MKINKFGLIGIFLLSTILVSAKDYHLAKTGNDASSGALESPLLTIQAAANLALVI